MDIKNKKVEIVVTFETFRDHVVSKIIMWGLGAEFVFHLFLDDQIFTGQISLFTHHIYLVYNAYLERDVAPW